VVAEGGVAARLVAAGVAGPPGGPGVYAFRDGAGGLLYVGTSADLRRRIRSYFSPRHAPASKAARIVRLAARVEWTTCPSVLEALVLEARTIAAARPHFNRRLKQPGAATYARFDPRDPYPRLEATRRLDDGPWRYAGPFPGGRRLGGALAELADAVGLRTCPGSLAPDPGGRACLRLDLGQCSAPCVARTTPGAYGRRLVVALAALGDVDVDVARAAGARAPADRFRAAGRIAGALRALRAARIARRVLVVVPLAGRAGHRLIAVGGGRIVDAASASTEGALGDAFAHACRALARPLPALLPRDALDEVRIVTAWLAAPAGRGATIDVGRLGRAAAWTEVLARAASGGLFSSGEPRASS
jgi:DNA polymerase-3 subunit epsilon